MQSRRHRKRGGRDPGQEQLPHVPAARPDQSAQAGGGQRPAVIHQAVCIHPLPQRLRRGRFVSNVQVAPRRLQGLLPIQCGSQAVFLSGTAGSCTVGRFYAPSRSQPGLPLQLQYHPALTA